jgi:hypothetical protein
MLSCCCPAVALLFLQNKFTYSSFCGAGATNATKNRALALQVAEAYESATWATDKVLILRAYLLSSCAGTFNALFTGNGFTASGKYSNISIL